jgi:PTH2 family peptidyl-tRNA hydrolase
MRTDVKQVILVRKDLKMPSGKIGAQVAHASMRVLLEQMDRQVISTSVTRKLTYEVESPMDAWLSCRFTKVCLRVDSEEELLDLYNKAKDKCLPCSLVTDAGFTVFNGVPTNTCVAIGPHWSETINEITGHLKLLR